MSEYQYYEFRAIDRHLSPDAMAELRAISTRAEITPTGLTNTYHWGDFKGDPKDLMGRYFDAFVYVANWGTRRLMLRVPRACLDAGAAADYTDAETLTLTARKSHAVLEFRSEDESGDWSDDEGTDSEEWMPSLIGLRAELMRGDLRALYIGWLASLRANGWEETDEGDDADEPPVPPGLAKLSAPLRALAEFLRVDDELIKAAAAGSLGEPPAEPSRAEVARWVATLPTAEKDAYLVRLLADDGDPSLVAELTRRFHEATLPRLARPTSGGQRRTVAQLLAARDTLVAEKERKAAERAAQDRAKREREAAEARTKSLDRLATREPAAWREVETLIATKRQPDYDRAVTLLADLRDLAARTGRVAAADALILQVRQRHANKPSLLKRLDLRGLGKSPNSS